MEKRDNPAYLQSLIREVEQFQTAFETFLTFHTTNLTFGRGLVPAVTQREDADPAEVEAASAAVNRAAGRAGAATALTNVFFNVQSMGVIDPIAAWHTVTTPKPVLEPANIQSACGLILGRLEALLVEAELSAPPTIGAAAMHPLIWGAARRLWLDRHFRLAVATASEALVGNVKALVHRNDLPETALWQEVFSDRPPSPGKPRLRWPGPADDRSVKTMNDGLRHFAPGVQMTVRNTATHVGEEMPEQQALEQLAILSQLAHWVDNCKVATAEEVSTP